MNHSDSEQRATLGESLLLLAFQGRIVSNNSVPASASPLDGQVFHIREEGKLDRWFNLTITNVGIEVRVARQRGCFAATDNFTCPDPV